MNSRYLLVAPLVAVFALCSSWSTPDAAPTHSSGQDTTTLDDQVELAVTVYNSDIALVRDVRNLAAAARRLRPALHGHRRDGESGDRALPIADRAVARQRARAELRIRPARAGQAAAQVRRPRRHARAHAPGGRHDARGRSEGAAPQLQQRAGLADRRRDRHRHAAPITSGFRSCPAISTRGRR